MLKKIIINILLGLIKNVFLEKAKLKAKKSTNDYDDRAIAFVEELLEEV